MSYYKSKFQVTYPLASLSGMQLKFGVRLILPSEKEKNEKPDEQENAPTTALASGSEGDTP